MLPSPWGEERPWTRERVPLTLVLQCWFARKFAGRFQGRASSSDPRVPHGPYSQWPQPHPIPPLQPPPPPEPDTTTGAPQSYTPVLPVLPPNTPSPAHPIQPVLIHPPTPAPPSTPSPALVLPALSQSRFSSTQGAQFSQSLSPVPL